MQIATIVLLVVLGSCRQDCDCAAPIARPRAELLLPVPATLYVLEGNDFILRARHLDAAGGVQPIANGALEWKPQSGGLTVGQTGRDSAVITANPLAAATRDTVKVTVEWNDSLSAEAVVIVVAEAPTADKLDRIVARAEMYPNYALIDGHANPVVNSQPPAGPPLPVCRSNSSIAFVGVGSAGELIGNCPSVPATPGVKGEITVFAATHGVLRKDVPWTPGLDMVDVASPPVPRPAPVTVSYSVVMAAIGSETQSIQSEIDLARQIFRREATGLELIGTIATTPSPAASVAVASRNVPLECANVRADLRDAGVPDTFGGKTLTVVYVDDILGPPYGAGETSYPSGLLGYSCPPNDLDGGIILISWGLRSTTTLAHELGHALGLRDDAGHTNDLPGFSYTNLMWAGQDASRTVPRAHFTLGQAFRMNFDSRSWLHRSTDVANKRPQPAQSCDATDASLPCPPLAWDVVIPPGP